jgi:hypothetical protein
VTICKTCPDSTYAATAGASQCQNCSLPLCIVTGGGSSCLELGPIYIATILFCFAFAFAIALIGASVTVCLGVGYRILGWWKSQELHRVTLLIQKRARDEILADLLIRYRDLKMESVIGAGSFARVYRGRWNHTRVAIKELTGVHALMATLEAERDASISEADSRQDEGIQRLVSEFRSEVPVMSRLHHPNVLLLVGACSEFPNLCIVTEYVPHGSLHGVLHRKRAAEQITLTQQFQWLGETAGGMAYLHDQDLMHRD